ncbi:MAG: DUF4129 domain-containing protein [Gammaproteobacteria bacterium]
MAHFRNELGDAGKQPGKSWFSDSLKQLDYAWDLVNNSWNQWVIGYNNQSQKSLFRAIGIPEISWRGLSYVLFATLGFFTVLVAINIFRAQRIRKTAIEKIYQQFLGKLRPLHMEKLPSEGALSFSRRVSQRLPAQSSELMHVAKLYNQIRYADSSPDLVESLKQAVKSIKINKNR